MPEADKKDNISEVQISNSESLQETTEINLASDPIEKIWANLPMLEHLPPGQMREQLETRRRLRKIRYMLYSLRTQCEKKEPLENVPDLLPGFIKFWLNEKPSYALDPIGKKIPVPQNKNKTINELGGYATFAQVWDVDHELNVYIRHSSVWQEWNSTLSRVVPMIGD
jgi:hypothetical protein